MTEEVKKEETTEEPKELDMIDKAKLAASDLRAANVERLKIIEREERLLAESKLGGETTAGKEEVKKEETPQDYAKRAIQNKL